jgi:hypothetical protein
MSKHGILCIALLPAALAAACSSSVSTSGSTSSGTTHAGGSGTTVSVTVSSSSGTGGTGGGGGGAGGAGGACSSTPATTTFVPMPADIQFQAVNALPHGEQIVFNDWNPSPNTLSSMTPDGVTTTKVLEAFRVWSLGVSHAGTTIAFACGDPEQQQHYGLSIGDAIQHTWLYDVATQQASLLTDGNVNDECHTFGPGDTSLYICRRYDFTGCGDNQGYQIGVIALPGGAFTFLSPDDPSIQALDPQPTPDGTELYFDEITSPMGQQSRDLYTMPLPMGAVTKLRGDAGTPVLSPDGTRYVYASYGDAGNLHVSALDGTGDVRVTGTQGDSATWSPDGTKIAYLYMDMVANCSHVEVVSADGSDADTPTRIRDCSATQEFITALAWFQRP